MTVLRKSYNPNTGVARAAQWTPESGRFTTTYKEGPNGGAKQKFYKDADGDGKVDDLYAVSKRKPNGMVKTTNFETGQSWITNTNNGNVRYLS